MWVTRRTTSKTVVFLNTRNGYKRSAIKSTNGMTSASAIQSWIRGSPRMRTTLRLMRVLPNSRARMRRKKISSQSRLSQIGRAMKTWLRVRNIIYEDRPSDPRIRLSSLKERFECAYSRLLSKSLRTLTNIPIPRIMSWVSIRAASEGSTKPTPRMMALMQCRMKIQAQQIRETEVFPIFNPMHSLIIHCYSARKALE